MSLSNGQRVIKYAVRLYQDERRAWQTMIESETGEYSRARENWLVAGRRLDKFLDSFSSDEKEYYRLLGKLESYRLPLREKIH